MPDEKELQSGRRLAQDLRHLREERGVSIDALHDETKIPMGLIESFEEDALFGHTMFNKVYLRSFIRTYAQVVGLEVDRVTQALEAALNGEYAGELTDMPAEAAAEQREEEEVEPEAPKAAEGAGVAGGGQREEEAEEREEEAAEAGAARRERPERRPEREERQAARREEEPSPEAAAGAVTSPPRARRKDAGERAEKKQSRSSGPGAPTWVYVVGGLVVAALLVWLFIAVFGGDGGPETAQQPTIADTAEAAGRQDTARRDPAFEPVNIGDSIDVEVVAAEGPVRELRVRPDDQTRRPHWIEQGQSLSFQAANQITFSPPVEATRERPLDMMRLLVEGREYPTTQRNAEGQIVITRERAQTVLDSLARAQQGS